MRAPLVVAAVFVVAFVVGVSACPGRSGGEGEGEGDVGEGEGDSGGEGEGEGEGEACRPVLTIDGEPSLCVFGTVAVGDTGTCALVLRAGPDCDLDVSVAVDGPGYVVDIAGPTTIAAGASLQLTMTVTPTAADPAPRGTLTLTTSSPPRATVEIELVTRAAPVCAITMVDAAGATVDEIVPLTAVSLSAATSTAADGGPIVTARWTIEDEPASTRMSLLRPDQIDPIVRNVALDVNDGFDVVGDYTFGLDIEDAAGGQAHCSRTITVAAPPGLYVDLRWDGPGDLDLHVARAGAFCGVDDCYFARPEQDWRAAGTSPEVLYLLANQSGDPGVEVFHLVDPADASYVVGVGFYSSSRDGDLVTVTARVFVDGAVVHESTHSLRRDDQWLPARVDIVDGAASVVVLDDASQQPGGCW